MGKINKYDNKITIENQKKRNMEIKQIFIYLHPIDGLGMEFTAC